VEQRGHRAHRRLDVMEKPFVAGTQIIQPAFTITPFSPPSSLRRGYDRQAGPVTGSFNGLHW
jgi:hypothetical protein